MDIGYNERSRNGVTSTIPAPDVRPTRDRQNAVANAKPIPQLSPEQIERFWSKVEVPEQPSCCWEWTGYRLPNGYGRFMFNDKEFYAHRVVCAILTKDPGPTLTIDHLCRNRGCVNPDHLEAVTQKVNNLRGFSSSALKARQTHCIHGHEFTPENTLLQGGKRSCRMCAYRRSMLAWQKAKRQKVAAIACAICGVEFFASDSKVKYCSDECRLVPYRAYKALQQRRRRAKRKAEGV